jgi:hypothetical protein
MSINTLPQRIELVVWTTSTHLMKNSTFVAQAVILVHDFYQWLTTQRTNYKVLLLALSGFCVGFVGGLIYLGIR